MRFCKYSNACLPHAGSKALISICKRNKKTRELAPENEVNLWYHLICLHGVDSCMFLFHSSWNSPSWSQWGRRQQVWTGHNMGCKFSGKQFSSENGCFHWNASLKMNFPGCSSFLSRVYMCSVTFCNVSYAHLPSLFHLPLLDCNQ